MQDCTQTVLRVPKVTTLSQLCTQTACALIFFCEQQLTFSKGNFAFSILQAGHNIVPNFYVWEG